MVSVSDAEIYNSFFKIGCCQTCCLRILGERNICDISNISELLKKRGIKIEENNVEDENSKVKQQKVNACISCLGFLQPPYCNDLINKITGELERFDYDCATFNVALVLPAAMQLRAHSLYLYFENNYQPDSEEICFQIKKNIRGMVKDAWKGIFISKLKDKFFDHREKSYDPQSHLVITIKMGYVDEGKECSLLTKMLPKQFSKTKNRKHFGSSNIYSKKGIEEALESVSDDCFRSYFPCPAQIPNEFMVLEEVKANHLSIHIGGRYNKWSRELSQTPWIIDGVRRMEGSVQEVITESLLKLTLATDAKFSSAGREDVDVRTLGRGRPFCIELLDPKRTAFTKENFNKLEADINELGRNKVSVKHLQMVRKEDLNLLKDGEEIRPKDYSALCIIIGKYNNIDNSVEACLERLHNLSTPLTILQATPVRVLHRRPVAVRKKVIHTLKGYKISKDQFVLHLKTQAGTYIKEFVHGDLGRTVPCLGELLGGFLIDILALDVQDVSLEWPPVDNYSNGNSVDT